MFNICNRLVELRPSSALCSLEIGDRFLHENGTVYQLLWRDAVKAVVRRYGWWEKFVVWFRAHQRRET
jgi:hypothetical protein